MKKKIGLVLLAALILVQFIRPSRNESSTASTSGLASLYPVPDNVDQIFKKACNDCHSNNTIYPWYTNVQPVGLWMQRHVNEGKRELNLDEFATYSARKQHHKLEECIEQVKKDEMPLNSYTWIHKDAILTDAEKATLTGWLQQIMDDIAVKNNLPKEEERKQE